MLIVNNLKKTYDGKKYVVDNVNLEIENGQIFAFVGHNGAGKTTTIKSIVGILDFEQGEISLNGLNLKDDETTFKKQIAYIPDNPNLYENLTGIAYLNFISDIYDLNKAEVKEDILKYADDFEIRGRLSDQIKSYSHGMKQKLALISAFIRKPKLLILDEPFVGLDPSAAFKTKEMMKNLTRSGSIIFFSTHILEVAEKLCDHVAIIKDGKIVVEGKMNEVKGDKSLENVFLELLDNE
ncbi:MAG TPA: ABC transporter ATP-binding protein [Acholeplasma sp.]|jgi:ABC-2 type transport system ATP-binding protein|nr:ABC transporter ATP-binding protein [Acholeplasma sp.]